MAKYFNYFPKTAYYLEDDKNSLSVVTNLTTKFSFDSEFKNNSSIYYEYTIPDGQTPEILAHKLYGSAERHWIILAANDIMHPQFDWPLEQRALNNYIETKYLPSADTANGQTGTAWSKTNIKEYNITDTKTITTIDKKTTTIIVVDQSTYANTVDSVQTTILNDGNPISVNRVKSVKTYYDYEIRLNENKRNIKLIRPEFVGLIEEEFKRTLSA
jgi:hypothetical protein